MHKYCLSVVALLAITLTGFSQEITTIAEINSVDAEGNPTFAGLDTTDQYTIEGVAINDPAVFNAADDSSYILFVQDDTGGIQVYSGFWYGGGLANYPSVRVGDRVRVTGMTGHFGGKTNINERHNPDQKFEITVLDSGSASAPFIIEDLAAANEFDATRQTGGEFYQGRLVTLRGVKIIEGDWENGAMLTVEDINGGRMQVELRAGTKIGDSPRPREYPYYNGYSLSITGVFDQEDTEAPYTGTYLVWPRSIEDFQPTYRGGDSGVDDWDVYK